MLSEQAIQATNLQNKSKLFMKGKILSFFQAELVPKKIVAFWKKPVQAIEKSKTFMLYHERNGQ